MLGTMSPPKPPSKPPLYDAPGRCPACERKHLDTAVRHNAPALGWVKWMDFIGIVPPHIVEDIRVEYAKLERGEG